MPSCIVCFHFSRLANFNKLKLTFLILIISWQKKRLFKFTCFVNYTGTPPVTPYKQLNVLLYCGMKLPSSCTVRIRTSLRTSEIWYDNS